MSRRKCEYPGCNTLGRNKGKYKNKTRYDRFCEMHHRLRCSKTNDFFKEWRFKQNIDNYECSICGWDKASCDRHRIDPKRGYTLENIAVLCPNCHRLAETGVIKL